MGITFFDKNNRVLRVVDFGRYIGQIIYGSDGGQYRVETDTSLTPIVNGDVQQQQAYVAPTLDLGAGIGTNTITPDYTPSTGVGTYSQQPQR